MKLEDPRAARHGMVEHAVESHGRFDAVHGLELLELLDGWQKIVAVSTTLYRITYFPPTVDLDTYRRLTSDDFSDSRTVISTKIHPIQVMIAMILARIGVRVNLVDFLEFIPPSCGCGCKCVSAERSCPLVVLGDRSTEVRIKNFSFLFS